MLHWVLEHTVEWGTTAQATVQGNLDIYEGVMKDAQAMGVRLLVTPEYGITGFVGSDRSEWFAYAADVPEVPENRTVLCETAAGLPYVVRRLSCLAKQYRMALVASVVDMKNCNTNPAYAECHVSRDGKLLFNTDVVFDSDGAFLAKYHKANLWGEVAVDASADCRAASFTLRDPNVTFGMFTCADLINGWPALHLASQGIRHFVMPLAWTNEMAQMQALSWLQSWSLVANATLLAANARDRGKETGSGIFSQGKAIKVAYDLAATAPRQLVVAPLPRLPDVPPTPAACGPKPKRPVPREGPRPVDRYQVQWLDMTPGNHSASLCYKRADRVPGVCCKLDYVAAQPGRGFVLAALDGEDRDDGIDPWVAEVCAVMACARGTQDCLKYPTEDLLPGPAAFGTFGAVELRADFPRAAQVYPVAVAAPGGVLAGRAVVQDGSRLSVTDPEALKELVSLELYGRVFAADVPRRPCSCGTGPAPPVFEERRYSREVELLTLKEFQDLMPTTFQDEWEVGPREKRRDPRTGRLVDWASRPQDASTWLSWPVALQWRRYPGGEFYTLAAWRSYCEWEAPSDWICQQYAGDWRRVWNSLPEDPPSRLKGADDVLFE